MRLAHNGFNQGSSPCGLILFLYKNNYIFKNIKIILRLILIKK